MTYSIDIDPQVQESIAAFCRRLKRERRTESSTAQRDEQFKVGQKQTIEETKILTTLEMARAEFGFYTVHLALYNGEVEPLHGHTFQITLRSPASPIPLE